MTKVAEYGRAQYVLPYLNVLVDAEGDDVMEGEHEPCAAHLREERVHGDGVGHRGEAQPEQVSGRHNGLHGAEGRHKRLSIVEDKAVDQGYMRHGSCGPKFYI